MTNEILNSAKRFLNKCDIQSVSVIECPEKPFFFYLTIRGDRKQHRQGIDMFDVIEGSEICFNKVDQVTQTIFEEYRSLL
jgi:hypothetical protein